MARDGLPIAQLKGRPLGRVLIKMGKVTRAQISEALELQKTKRGPLGQLLIELGYVNERDVHIALAAQAGMESITLSEIDIDQVIIDLLPSQMANTYRLVPTDYDKPSNTIWVALASPDNFQATDDLKTLMGFNVVARITTPDDVAKLDQQLTERAALALLKLQRLGNLGPRDLAHLDQDPPQTIRSLIVSAWSSG